MYGISAPVKKKINLNILDEIPKKSPNPPQTPEKTLSVLDFLNLLNGSLSFT